MSLDVNDRGSLLRSRAKWRKRLRFLNGQRHKVIALIHRRTKQLKRLNAQGERARAVEVALKIVGKHEDPGRPNRAPWLDVWARRIGPWMVGQPWCGLTVWEICRHVGVTLSTQTVSTVAIRDMAQRKTGGYRGWTNISHVQPGDFIVYGFNGTGPQHVGVYVGNGKVVEGNTSPGHGGSQNDGGGIYIRTVAERRPYILGVAQPAYKN